MKFTGGAFGHLFGIVLVTALTRPMALFLRSVTGTGGPSQTASAAHLPTSTPAIYREASAGQWVEAKQLVTQVVVSIEGQARVYLLQA